MVGTGKNAFAGVLWEYLGSLGGKGTGVIPLSKAELEQKNKRELAKKVMQLDL